MFSLNFRQLPSHEALHLMFASPRLKKLDLSCFFVKSDETFSADDPYAPPHLKVDVDIHVSMNEAFEIHLRTKKHMEDECNSLLHMLSKDPQPDLQSFVMTKRINISKFALQQLIQVSTNLTEIHTLIDGFDLNVLVNCKRLRILRLHISFKTDFSNCSWELLDTFENVLSSLGNLQIFTICNNMRADCFGIRPLIATALDHCPKLTSVGHFDSAMAIDYIKIKSHIRYLNLKKCFWGIQVGCDSAYKQKEIQYLKHRFPELINTAVFHCPFVEELSLQVLHKDCLQHLRRLKRLNSLVLECTFCNDLAVDECFSSLGEIRHQLKHLVIHSPNVNRRFPLNVVINNCENLETLGVLELTAIDFPLRTNTRFRRLKRISIKMNLNYLGEILRYCDNLTYLLLFGHCVINESELLVNLSNVSALKLQTLGIQSRFFSENAVKMVLETAPNLERVSFFHKRECVSLLKELGSSIVFDYKLLRDENYFPPELQPCIF
ncbi:uncharacterized protein CDAR_522871 [Caerostris darwini]|uniref:Uncharacterized protein n=1 Tax=Caerostris darwini TaxID=1538125 RepID=A0AAV4VC01_9ARAC|nr:uncharacterized protein CDAR_522871 [Caerostris darwini]